jgi:hypothetical protein
VAGLAGEGWLHQPSAFFHFFADVYARGGKLCSLPGQFGKLQSLPPRRMSSERSALPSNGWNLPLSSLIYQESRLAD